MLIQRNVYKCLLHKDSKNEFTTRVKEHTIQMNDMSQKHHEDMSRLQDEMNSMALDLKSQHSREMASFRHVGEENIYLKTRVASLQKMMSSLQLALQTDVSHWTTVSADNNSAPRSMHPMILHF